MTSDFTVFPNVKVGKGAAIEKGVIIGLPPAGKKPGELKTVIGKNAYIRANTVIYAGVKVGDNFQTGPSVLIREDNKIGDEVVIWHSSTLNPGNKIGNGTRIHAGCFLEDVTLGKNIFLGPHVVFTNDPHPLVPIDFRDCWMGAKVGNGASIGANVTVLPHVSIGRLVVVGAGSVVTKDIPFSKAAVGNPAVVIKKVEDIICDRSGILHRPYQKRKK